MFGNSNKSQESFLELFQNAAQARLSVSSLDSPKKDTLKNILISNSNSPLSTKVSSPNFDSNTAALKNFLIKGSDAVNSGSSEAIQILNDSEVLVQFKKASLEGKTFSGGMLAVSGSFLAYLVSEKKVRIFNTLTGQKCSIDRAQGFIVGLAWSDDLGQPGTTFLAVLAEDGEITIGRISANESDGDEEGLCFEVTSILSFPEIGRARAISWNRGGEIGGKKHLAVYGNASSDVFFVHCSAVINGKSSFINTFIQDIKNVSLMDTGSCWVVGRDGLIENFQYTGSSYQPSFSFQLPVKSVDFVEVTKIMNSTYFIVLSDNVLHVFSLNSFDKEPLKISSLDLEFPANEFILNLETQTLVLFTHGKREVQVVSLAKMNSPQLVINNLNPKSSAILDAIFEIDTCERTGNTINFSVLFYFSDLICRQEATFELNSKHFEIEPECEEIDRSIIDESASEDEEIIDKDGIFVENMDKEKSAVNNLKDEIKCMVKDAIKESLSEIIYDALNEGIRAGFAQISEELINLTRNLIKSVENGIESNLIPQSLSSKISQDSNDENQTILDLISQGKLGLALRKSAEIGNYRLLLEVCRKFEDPFTALDEEQLMQETLTQMFGLLSLDIDEDTEVKLDWLQEILIQIDLDSDLIENTKLSEQVDVLFDELRSLVNDSLVDGNLQKKMKTVMRLLRKFQMN